MLWLLGWLLAWFLHTVGLCTESIGILLGAIKCRINRVDTAKPQPSGAKDKAKATQLLAIDIVAWQSAGLVNRSARSCPELEKCCSFVKIF